MIDASILQGVRPLDFKIPSQVDSYKNALALQGGMTQNALAQYTLAKAQRDDAETEAFNRALRSADLSTPEGRAAAQRAAMSAAPTKGIGFANQLLEQETKRATLDKTRAETAKQLADQAARMIANAKTDQEMDQAFQFWSRGNPEQASVVRNQYMAARQSGAQVPDLAPKIASLFSEDVLKQIKAFAPEVKPQDVGGTVQFVNTNTLAGPVGPVQGVNALAKTNTPDAMLTDTRAREEGAANRGVTMRGQNMADARAREQTEQGRWTNDLVRGVQVNSATGETRPITANGKPIGPKDDAPEAMLKAAGYADRMKKASVLLDKFAAAGKPGLAESGLQQLPKGAGNIAANLARSPERQQYRQAQEDWVRAKLRQESGAVIADEEMAREIRTYFPEIGDSDAVVKQKSAARKTAEQAMITAAGKAAKSSGASGGWKIERE